MGKIRKKKKDTSLARLIKIARKKILENPTNYQYQELEWSLSTDSTFIKMIIWKKYEQFCGSKFGNLPEMNTVLESH